MRSRNRRSPNDFVIRSMPEIQMRHLVRNATWSWAAAHVAIRTHGPLVEFSQFMPPGYFALKKTGLKCAAHPLCRRSQKLSHPRISAIISKQWHGESHVYAPVRNDFLCSVQDGRKRLTRAMGKLIQSLWGDALRRYRIANKDHSSGSYVSIL